MNALRLLLLLLLLPGCAALGDINAAGPADFARVRDGMTREDTQRLLGKPSETMRFPLSGNQSWDYPFQDAWGYLALFSVIFGPQGTVIGTTSQRLNDGGDHGQ